MAELNLDTKARQTTIHEKGFRLSSGTRIVDEGPNLPPGVRNYGKIKLGPSTLDDATLELGNFRPKLYPHFSKAYILKCLHDNDIPRLI